MRNPDTGPNIGRRGFMSLALGVGAAAVGVSTMTGCGNSPRTATPEVAQETPEPWELNEKLYLEYIDSLPTREEQLAKYQIPLGLTEEQIAEEVLRALDYRQNYGVDPATLYELFDGSENTPEGLIAQREIIEEITRMSFGAFRDEEGMFTPGVWSEYDRSDTKIIVKWIENAQETALRQALEDPTLKPVQREVVYAEKRILPGNLMGYTVYYIETGGAGDMRPLSPVTTTPNGESVDGCLTFFTNEALPGTPEARDREGKFTQVQILGMTNVAEI